MRPSNVIALNAADASADKSFVIDATSLMSCSVQVIMTGTSSGALKLQFSNDPNTVDPTHFSDITSATVTLTGTAGVFAIQKNDICCQWIKLTYTKNNGAAGTITANFHSWGF